MYVDFEKLPSTARVWIYQTDRDLTLKEENEIAYKLKAAITTWTAHGNGLLASSKIDRKRFVVIALDEAVNQASGCSIDASTSWLKQMSLEMNIDFFDRSILYLAQNEIKSANAFGLKKVIEQGLISEGTIVFNSLGVKTIADMKSNWMLPANKIPFLGKYFQPEAA